MAIRLLNAQMMTK